MPMCCGHPMLMPRSKASTLRKHLAMPGVVAIFTGAEMSLADQLGGLPCGWGVTDRHGQPMAEPPHPLLVTDRARHVGDNVALVIADSLGEARDAVEAITVDYAPMPAVSSASTALGKKAPLVHDDIAGNLCYDWEIGDATAVDQAFAAAAKIASVDVVNNRVVPNAMEPRAANAIYDMAADSYTLYMTSQNPHVIRLLMGAFVLQIPEHKLRIIAPDVGGGFGSKIYHYAEEALVTWASKKVGRPVKWSADRSEAFVTDAHGRDHVSHAEMALDANGKFLAMRVETTANMGAYLSTFAPSIPTYFYALMFSGQYTTPSIHVRVRAAFTHTTPVDAYRGAGRSECMYLLERLVDEAARVTGLDPVEIRRRNLIAKRRLSPSRHHSALSMTVARSRSRWTRRLRLLIKMALPSVKRRRRKRTSCGGRASLAGSSPRALRPQLQ